jgi:diguanylate cyclase (GGDEF)-like protein
MIKTTETLLQSVFALDRQVLNAADFSTLAASLVEWAMRAGADAAYAGMLDEQGRLQTGQFAGEGVREYIERACVHARTGGSEDIEPFGRAWRTRHPLIAALPPVSDGMSGKPIASDPPWRVSAVVPLTHDGRRGGLLCLFAHDAARFAAPEWMTAFEHIELMANTVLYRIDLHAEQESLRNLSLRDPLTGLPNMTGLGQYLQHAVPRAQRENIPLVVGLIDLDRFKPVNDLFGHDAGDRVLCTTAARIQNELRKSDFIARVGGDEFVMVLEGVRDPVSALIPFLEQLNERLTQPVPIGDTSWQCGASLGLALWRDTRETHFDTVMAEADRALRESKMQRGHRTHWWHWALPEAVPPKRAGVPGAAVTALYESDAASQLAPLSEALQRRAVDVVNDFYLRLARLPKSRIILDELTGPELQHLKSQQIQNLFTLAGADLTEADHRAMALRVGRIHAIVGLDREELVRSRGILAAAIGERLGDMDASEALALLSRRLNRDLAWQTEAYQQLQDERQHMLMHIARLAWKSESYADLIDGTVDILGACDEVAGCSIGQPDRHGVFRVEAAAGRILERLRPERMPDAGEAHHAGGLALYAWRSRMIERCVNVATDPRMTPWLAMAKREGLRSGVAIPLCQSGHAPTALLMLYSAYPGGYSSSDQIAFTDMLQTLLAFAMSRIANQQGATRTVSYATRRRWKSLLRSDALRMYCQPMLDLKTARVTKVEMLARIFDGSRLLTPREFLPVFTSDDLLELYVRGLGQSLSYRKRWLYDGNELNVSVNLPSSAFGDIRYFKATQDALAKYGCPPDALMLEVLETDALPSDVDIGTDLARFRALGIKLAEDDLGSDHSGLWRLRELPFDWIKIDRGTVKLSGHNRSGMLNFIHQLTRLGHALGKSVIVEGVEDDALLEAVVILQADAVQGYRIAEPMPADELTGWIARNVVPRSSAESPKSAFGKLARLLIWEERLHLLLSDTKAFEHIASILRTPLAVTEHLRMPASVQSFCRACPLTNFFVDIKSLLQDNVGDLMEQQALIDAAITHGRNSAAYADARRCLIDTFETDSKVE